MSHTTSNDFLLTCGIFFTENKTKKIVEPHYCHLNSISAIVNVNKSFCRAKKSFQFFSQKRQSRTENMGIEGNLLGRD